VTETGDRDSDPTWWLLVVGLALLAVFCWWERRVERRGRGPVVRLGLLRLRSYSVGALTVTFFFAGYPGMLILTQFFFQQGLHQSALAAAATTVPFGLASSLGAVLGGRLVHRFGRWVVVVGCLAVVIGVAATALLVHAQVSGSAALMLIGPFVLSGVGSGFIMAPNQTLAMADVPRAEGSIAAGIYQVGMRIGQSVGMPLAFALYSAGLTHWNGDVFTAAAVGMGGSALFVVLALLTRLIDIMYGRRARTETSP
jgi:MFS family permease